MPDEPTTTTESLGDVFLSWLRSVSWGLAVFLFYLAVGFVILLVVAIALGMHGPLPF
jgi:hypothetical protein